MEHSSFLMYEMGKAGPVVFASLPLFLCKQNEVKGNVAVHVKVHVCRQFSLALGVDDNAQVDVTVFADDTPGQGAKKNHGGWLIPLNDLPGYFLERCFTLFSKLTAHGVHPSRYIAGLSYAVYHLSPAVIVFPCRFLLRLYHILFPAGGFSVNRQSPRKSFQGAVV